jgi:hypothetical protein
MDGRPGRVCFIGPRAPNGFTQINVFLPEEIRTGMVPVHLVLRGRKICPDAHMRVITPGPSVPRLIGLSDAVNLLSPRRIESRFMKAILEEVDHIESFSATVDSIAAIEIETFRADPLARRWEVNFQIPEEIGSGGHWLEVRLGQRLLARTEIEVVG